MKKKTEWITPFKKQCFVTLGACLNMASQGMTVGFAAILLPQLRKADSIIPIDANSGSWIASILGFALVGGNFIVPTIMANYGRRAANIASILPMLAGWFCILFATNLPTLLAARLLQGISMGMSSSLGPIIIGEYTSPNNRGPFLASISVTIATGVLVVHTMGSFVSWQMTALVCAIIGLVDLLIVIYSPETPSWLADQGRYDESRKIFRWLRGDEEEDELQRMIETSIFIRESKAEVNPSESFFKRIKRNLAYFGVTMRKGEFYKPIFIMMHVGDIPAFARLVLSPLLFSSPSMALGWVNAKRTQGEIGSILGFALVAGNFIVPTIIAKSGRKIANVAAILPMLAGWFTVLLAKSVSGLLRARFLQGVSMEMVAIFGTCFVTSGVSMNLMSHGLVVGFTSALLPQLQDSNFIPIDSVSGSWIASIISIALVAGALTLPFLMNSLGRRAANITSVTFMITGWFCITFATSVTTLILARFLQGFSMGLSASLCSVLIGEYTSPKNRGAFLTTISLAIACGTLITHALGSYIGWQTLALICAIITFVNLMIVINSPESPSYLVSKGRYDECRKAFHWLRGYNEEDELEKMIKTRMLNELKNEEKQTENKLQYYKNVFSKKKFYKPLILVAHLYMIGQWSGANILAAYTQEIFHTIIGNIDVSLMIISMDIQRIISNFLAIFVIRSMRRRPMLVITISMNFLSFLTIGIYAYFKIKGMLPYDHPFIGVMLIHIHMFSIATGSVPLPNIIAGEVFPLEYKGLAGTLSVLILSSNLFITLKCNPFFFYNLGLHGTYWLYASMVAYSLLISWWMLPETKDRTLQDIEEEFCGKRKGLSIDESASSILYEDSKNVNNLN